MKLIDYYAFFNHTEFIGVIVSSTGPNVVDKSPDNASRAISTSVQDKYKD